MNRTFISKNYLQRKKLTLDELNDYYIDERKHNFETTDKIKYIKEKQKLYRVLRILMASKRVLSGQTLEIVGDKRTKTNRPKIYSVSHIGKFDIEMVYEAIKDHTYILMGDAKYLYRTFDDLFLRLSGVIYTDTSSEDVPKKNDDEKTEAEKKSEARSKEDQRIAKETAIKILQQNGNIMWYPEGIWNVSPNQIIHRIKYGIIEAALRSNAIIIPVGVEQYGKNFCVNIGDNFDVNLYRNSIKDEKELKLEAIRDLRDKMAKLRWEIWERRGMVKRDSIPDDYYDKFVGERIAEWPYFTRDVLENRIFKNGIVTENEVFDFLNSENFEFNSNNAFLVKKRNF